MPRTRHSVPPNFLQSSNLDSGCEVNAASVSAVSLDFPHALFAPLHYTSGYAYPLLVWLHGRDSDERQLQRVMPLVSMQNYVAVAPQGARIAVAEESRGEHCGWSQESDQIEQAEHRVFDSIELSRRKLHIHPRRVFLCGFDTGGTMALRLAMSHPNSFAGVIAICGQFPTGGKPFQNLIAARRLGMFLATGRGSQEYTATQVCEDLRLLHTAGLSITLRQYPCGHEVAPQMLADINRWLMEQIAPPPTTATESDALQSHESD